MKRNIVARFFRRHGKAAFILSLPKNAKVLDVGCGNSSATYMKSLRPDIYYVGIDVTNYNNISSNIDCVDKYIESNPDNFSIDIENIGILFDAVVSNHNIEHCNDQSKTIRAMVSVLRVGGKAFLAFPSEYSVDFPSRIGTLNFYDDPTHQQVPRWEIVKNVLLAQGMEIYFSQRRYRPPLFYIFGALSEPWSAYRRRVDRWGAAWAFWGFESVIWARRAEA